ncbi:MULTISPECIES: T9SS type A sorting domain-containing protein [Pontibacter]|uniref:Por secretion system C-terminal sorting domain-containing protein n=1 Tax=Pontibacter lucknowensis TaxID=1077936 RepID=A0A1N6UV29_9BACT|nr:MULTISPECIES: T9SS type A sorting domain-containing protein [Pontibacter]SIQ69401.1 Por secretion system C-terminal sorting domain-containing protein [Pontibacter lucknowensis]
MKHIYTVIFALFVLVGSAQAQVDVYRNSFTAPTDLDRLNFAFTKAFSTSAPAQITNNTLAIRGNNGGKDVRGYSGHITVNTPITFNPGTVYTITLRARATEQDAQIKFLRGADAGTAGSENGTNIPNISPVDVIKASANTAFTNYTVTFTVNRRRTEYIAFYVSSIQNESNNANNEYLYIDAISITRTCGTIASPGAASVSRCGSGSVTLTATGAPVGGGYRWYGTQTGGTSLSSAASYTISLTNTTTFYVSAVNADGCESSRVPVTATINQKEFANTEFVKQSYEAGKPGMIKVNSDLFDRGHAVSIKWQSVNTVTRVVTDLGTTDAPAASPASLAIASMPAGDTYFQVTITPISSVCYDESTLFVTSQEIVSLPVELVSFKAQSTKDGVQLSWKTASELDNKGFEVEVSANGKNFRKIAFVGSKVGTTSLVQNYSYLDTRAAAGINYYRLKQVDLDGAFEYSKVVAVNNAAVASSSVYPTLASHEVTVRVAASDEQVMISVADMTGKQLLAIQNPSERQVVLPVQHLQNGIYFVTVTTGAQKEVIRFMKR